MARPPDPDRKHAVLQRATDHVLAHGLDGAALRAVAAAVGSSPRMLLYDFGSKEKLVAEILANARVRLAAMLADGIAAAPPTTAELVLDVWAWITHPDRVPYLRLFFEVYVDAIARPGAYPDRGRGMVEDWIAALTGNAELDEPTARMIVATIRGLLLDRLTAEDADATDAAARRFAQLLS